MCILLYFVGFLLVFLNLVGIGDYFFDRKSLECIWDWMVMYYYIVVFLVILVWILVFVMGFLYLNIYIMVIKSIKRMKKY